MGLEDSSSIESSSATDWLAKLRTIVIVLYKQQRE